MSTYITLQELIQFICKNSKLKICIHPIANNFYVGEFELERRYKIHLFNYCDLAKATQRGFSMCMECKYKATKKARKEKQLFFGHCKFGLFEVVKPVVINDAVVCIIYVGNAVLDPKKSIAIIKRSAREADTDPSVLEKELENAQPIDSAEQCIEIANILDTYIRLMYDKIDRMAIQKISFPSKLKEIIEHIEANYTNNITLTQMAKLFYINEKYLGRIFKKYMGESFHEYLNSLRIKQAAHLLETSDKSILEIAFECGYQNASYFARYFKRKYHITPSEYRRIKGKDK